MDSPAGSDLPSDVDPLAILSALGWPAADRVTPVSGGWDTSLWRIDVATRSYALRVFRPEQAEMCRREALVMQRLGEIGLPIPTVFATGVGEGRPALLLAWCTGRPVLQQLQTQPWRVWQLGVAMGRMQARIHAAAVSGLVQQGLPAWMARTEDATPELHAQLRALGDRSSSILHLDYHPLNVMSAGHQVTGVLDWANVAVGDRRADLARTVTLFRLPPTPPGTPALFQVLRAVLEAAWRHGYRELQAADPFVGLAPFYAWAGAMMERDLRPKLGRPGVWLQESDLLRIRRWTDRWRDRLAARP